jgi:hypothetical protein
VAVWCMVEEFDGNGHRSRGAGATGGKAQGTISGTSGSASVRRIVRPDGGWPWWLT